MLSAWPGDMRKPRIGIVTSHPIQYYSPVFRELAKLAQVHVFYAHRASSADQASAGYQHPFDWDVDLTSGFDHTFLKNRARRPSTSRFLGCDTPDIGKAISAVGPMDAVVLTGWNLKVYWQALTYVRSKGVPVAVRGDSQLGTKRSWVKRSIKSVVFGRILALFDAHLSVGVRSREYLVRYGVDPSKIFFSPHCVDNERFRGSSTLSQEKVDAIRSRWGLLRGEAAVLFVGRLVPGKRPFDLAQAVGSLNLKGTACRMIVAGSGPLEQGLREYCGRQGVPATFLGFVNQGELPVIYGAGDVLALPSDASETWGLVVNEAMASGRIPVVSDQVGCAPDLIDDGRTGYVFRCGDIGALSEALRQAFALASSGRARSAVLEKIDIYTPAAAAEGILRACRWAVERKAGP